VRALHESHDELLHFGLVTETQTVHQVIERSAQRGGIGRMLRGIEKRRLCAGDEFLATRLRPHVFLFGNAVWFFSRRSNRICERAQKKLEKRGAERLRVRLKLGAGQGLGQAVNLLVV
jgi:hypothetical protein